MGKHAYGPPSDMDPETTICMRKIFEAIEDARLRGESDTSSLHYKRHTKLKAKNALSHSQSVDSIESFGSRPEFVVRGLGTTADVPEGLDAMLSPPKSSKKKKRKKRRKRGGMSAALSLGSAGFSSDLSDAEPEYAEVELYALDDGVRCVAYELLRDSRPTNIVRVVVYDEKNTSRCKDLTPESYGTTGYAPLDELIDDEKAALAALLCSMVGNGSLDDLPRPYTPGAQLGPAPRPSSPVTASILAEFDEDD